MLKIGQKLPSFKMENQNGEMITEETLLGKKTILYFYPKDNTPTCTTQACEFNEQLENFNSLDVQVFGVSGDSKKKHQNFIAKHGLKFDLLVDEDYQYSESLGIYRMKKVFGKESKGIVRTTIILDEDNVVKEVFDAVKVKTQLDDIQKVLDGMK